ncbi:hypothetical protein Fmac_010080 [Flemingia macrophylla]|uniref:Uncharacterized protein n=1 Tax=Flemingia macrophylla TaxID=520843 RepID=A0ABD1N4L3_9FABA
MTYEIAFVFCLEAYEIAFVFCLEVAKYVLNRYLSTFKAKPITGSPSTPPALRSTTIATASLGAS